ncbi:MAG: hypothetical protein J5497_07695 [Selenomonadaceae bacterium]|nr:hypothetical protein [Selenomonadaceae bacterium]
MRISGDIKQMTVSQTQLGKAIGVSTPRVNQLIDEGVVVRDEMSQSGQVMLFESLQNYFLSKNVSGDNVNFWKERGLHERAKRELAELKLSKSRGEVYDATTVESVLVELLTNFRNKLLGLPSKYATRLEGKSRAEIYSTLTTAIEEELTELSEGVNACDFKDDEPPVDEDATFGGQAD